MIEVRLIKEFEPFRFMASHLHFDLEPDFQFITMVEFVVESKLEVFPIEFKERSFVEFAEGLAFVPITFDLQSMVLLSFRVAFTFKDYLVEYTLLADSLQSSSFDLEASFVAFIGQAMDSTTIIVALAFESCWNLQ